jgi:5'(3')-deoxyribonucleotidase
MTFVLMRIKLEIELSYQKIIFCTVKNFVQLKIDIIQSSEKLKSFIENHSGKKKLKDLVSK